ncbi:MAG: hypothetical protein ACOCWH_02920 [Spirochaetota bacterium]
MNVLLSQNTPDEYEELSGPGRTVHRVSLSELSGFSSSVSYDVAVVEASSTSIGIMNELSEREFRDTWILFTGDIDDSALCCQLKRSGFTRFVRPGDTAYAVSTWNREKYNGSEPLSLLILDDNAVHLRMISQISFDFGHQAVMVDSFDEFYSRLSREFDLILVNIHSAACDVPIFARKVHNITNFRRAAVIPYLQDEYCAIGDLYGGLNRIARAVLNLDELFHFLVQMFYKREMESERELLDSALSSIMGGDIRFSERPGVVYAKHGLDYMTARPDIHKNLLDDVERRSEMVLKLNRAVYPYLWLIESDDELTCGQGV